MPTWHPAYLLRNPGAKREERQTLEPTKAPQPPLPLEARLAMKLVSSRYARMT